MLTFLSYTMFMQIVQLQHQQFFLMFNVSANFAPHMVKLTICPHDKLNPWELGSPCVSLRFSLNLPFLWCTHNMDRKACPFINVGCIKIIRRPFVNYLWMYLGLVWKEEMLEYPFACFKIPIPSLHLWNLSTNTTWISIKEEA
jgi:hypothetical protein